MELLITVAIIHLFASLSPGPDVFLMMRNTIAGGVRAGIATTGGIVTGVSLQITACLTGVAVLITQNPTLERTISHAGAIYLIYLGIQPWLHRKDRSEPGQVHSQNKRWFQYFRQGLLTNLLNPKAILFFISLFTVLIEPEVPMPIQILAGIEMVLIQFLSFSSVSALLSAEVIAQHWHRWQHHLEKFISIVLIALAIRLWLPL